MLRSRSLLRLAARRLRFRRLRVGVRAFAEDAEGSKDDDAQPVVAVDPDATAKERARHDAAFQRVMDHFDSPEMHKLLNFGAEDVLVEPTPMPALLPAEHNPFYEEYIQSVRDKAAMRQQDREEPGVLDVDSVKAPAEITADDMVAQARKLKELYRQEFLKREEFANEMKKSYDKYTPVDMASAMEEGEGEDEDLSVEQQIERNFEARHRKKVDYNSLEYFVDREPTKGRVHLADDAARAGLTKLGVEMMLARKIQRYDWEGINPMDKSTIFFLELARLRYQDAKRRNIKAGMNIAPLQIMDDGPPLDDVDARIAWHEEQGTLSDERVRVLVDLEMREHDYIQHDEHLGLARVKFFEPWQREDMMKIVGQSRDTRWNSDHVMDVVAYPLIEPLILEDPETLMSDHEEDIEVTHSLPSHNSTEEADAARMDLLDDNKLPYHLRGMQELLDEGVNPETAQAPPFVFKGTISRIHREYQQWLEDGELGQLEAGTPEVDFVRSDSELAQKFLFDEDVESEPEDINNPEIDEAYVDGLRGKMAAWNTLSAEEQDSLLDMLSGEESEEEEAEFLGSKDMELRERVREDEEGFRTESEVTVGPDVPYGLPIGEGSIPPSSDYTVKSVDQVDREDKYKSIGAGMVDELTGGQFTVDNIPFEIPSDGARRYLMGQTPTRSDLRELCRKYELPMIRPLAENAFDNKAKLYVTQDLESVDANSEQSQEQADGATRNAYTDRLKSAEELEGWFGDDNTPIPIRKLRELDRLLEQHPLDITGGTSSSGDGEQENDGGYQEALLAKPSTSSAPSVGGELELTVIPRIFDLWMSEMRLQLLKAANLHRRETGYLAADLVEIFLEWKAEEAMLPDEIKELVQMRKALARNPEPLHPDPNSLAEAREELYRLRPAPRYAGESEQFDARDREAERQKLAFDSRVRERQLKGLSTKARKMVDWVNWVNADDPQLSFKNSFAAREKFLHPDQPNVDPDFCYRFELERYKDQDVGMDPNDVYWRDGGYNLPEKDEYHMQSVVDPHHLETDDQVSIEEAPAALDEEAQELMYQLHLMDPAVWHPRSLAPLFKVSMQKCWGYLNLMGYVHRLLRRGEMVAAPTPYIARHTRKWTTTWYESRDRPMATYDYAHYRANRGEARTEDDFAAQNQWEFEARKAKYMASQNERLAEEDAEAYKREGPIGATPQMEKLRYVDDGSLHSRTHFNTLMTDTSEGKKRLGNRFQIAVRDKYGRLREPTRDEFIRTRRREKTKFERFRYVRYRHPNSVELVSSEVLEGRKRDGKVSPSLVSP